MKAAVLTALRKIEIVDVPPPVLDRAEDVLIDVSTVGVCGSDVHYYTTGRIGSQVVKYPFRVGHEFSGVIRAVGRKVRNVKPGDRVAVDPAMPCGKCDQCLAGRRHTCRNLSFLGCPGQAEGPLCEQMVMPAHCCFPVKKKTTMEEAAFVEPLSIGWYAASLAGVVRRCAVGILGCGPIGLSVLMSVRAMGVRRAYVTDLLDYRLVVALRQGASWAGNPSTGDVERRISGLEPLLLDVVYECCGQQDAISQACRLLKPGGTLVIVGIPEVDSISFDTDIIRRREITIKNVRRQNECVLPAIRLIENRKAKVSRLITHSFPLDRASEAFELVAGYEDGVVKAIVTP